jgi:hypothetical protein
LSFPSGTANTISGNANLSSGLIAAYPFDGNANDATVNGNDGTVNGASLTDGFVERRAYDFDGVNDYISLPSVYSTPP